MENFEVGKDLESELAIPHRYLLEELDDVLRGRLPKWTVDVRRFEVHKATIVRDKQSAKSCISPYPWPSASRITSWFCLRLGEWSLKEFEMDAAHLLCPAGHPVRLSFVVSWPQELDGWKFWRDLRASCCNKIEGLDDVPLAT